MAAYDVLFTDELNPIEVSANQISVSGNVVILMLAGTFVAAIPVDRLHSIRPAKSTRK